VLVLYRNAAIFCVLRAAVRTGVVSCHGIRRPLFPIVMLLVHVVAENSRDFSVDSVYFAICLRVIWPRYLHNSQTFLKISAIFVATWSVRTFCGTPNMRIHLLTNADATVSARWSGRGTISKYLEKLSSMERMYVFPPSLHGSDPTVSSDIKWNGLSADGNSCNGALVLP
jgi:hypothetical protein